ncbi:hypothetical protein A9Q96_09930 [Rhodobacterales bacterium 52_120_T64]|nr:hypothetical protein A9Q96_09930 [Rhodobacterales bacterium 52_120_T64]
MVAEQQASSGKGLLVQFTKGMVDTLGIYFDKYASEGVINLESNQMGLWLINPRNSSRQFLGKATLVGRNTIRVPGHVHRQSECGEKAVAKG